MAIGSLLHCIHGNMISRPSSKWMTIVLSCNAVRGRHVRASVEAGMVELRSNGNWSESVLRIG